MRDPSTTTEDAPAPVPTLGEEIKRSLSSVWAHHAGGRPGSVSIEVRGDVIKLVRTEASNTEPEAAEKALEAGRSTDTVGYKHDAMTAVARLTHRRVVSFFAKSNAKTDVTTETFILERSLPKN